MDPYETLKMLLKALHDNDKGAALDHLENLTNWILNDGFLPDIIDMETVLSIITKSREQS